MFNFLHIELTSRCQKSCWMCGRRKMEREHPELCNWGDMPLEMVKWIASQVPRGTVVQLHNNGESTLYPDLGAALNLFSHCIRQFNTNAKLLMERADEIIGNLETLTISVIPKDPEAENQFEIVQKFLEKKESDRRKWCTGYSERSKTRSDGNIYREKWRGECSMIRRAHAIMRRKLRSRR